MAASEISASHVAANFAPPIQQPVKEHRQSKHQKELPKILLYSSLRLCLCSLQSRLQF